MDSEQRTDPREAGFRRVHAAATVLRDTLLEIYHHPGASGWVKTAIETCMARADAAVNGRPDPTAVTSLPLLEAREFADDDMAPAVVSITDKLADPSRRRTAHRPDSEDNVVPLFRSKEPA